MSNENEKKKRRVTENCFVAIETKYIPATSCRGSRVKAFTRGGRNGRSITIGFDEGNGTFEGHKKASVALCDKMNWEWNMIAGGTETGYVFVFVVGE